MSTKHALMKLCLAMLAALSAFSIMPAHGSEGRAIPTVYDPDCPSQHVCITIPAETGLTQGKLEDAITEPHARFDFDGLKHWHIYMSIEGEQAGSNPAAAGARAFAIAERAWGNLKTLNIKPTQVTIRSDALEASNTALGKIELIETGNEAHVLLIVFQGNNSKIPDSAYSPLQEIVDIMKADADKRLEIISYASGDKARRLSVMRALVIRTYLISYGVDSARMIVKPLGDKGKTEPYDAVEIYWLPR